MRALLAPAPVPAPARALALDAMRVSRALRDPARRPARWASRRSEHRSSSFGATSRRSRADVRWRRRSDARRSTSSRPRRNATTRTRIRLAYALRWLELGRGQSPSAPGRPCSTDAVAVRPAGRRNPRRPVGPRLSLRGHAPVPPLLHHAPRRPVRSRDGVPSVAAARRLRPPARLGDLFAAAARQARQRSGRAGHPRGAEPDRRPGDGDAGRAPGGHLAIERSVRRDRARARPVQGPERARHGAGDDPRGGRRPPAGRHRPVVPPAADAGLPLPDEVARRAALARRADPRPRVRDEGRLQLRPRRGRASTPATGTSTGPTSGPSSGSGSRPSRSARTSG